MTETSVRAGYALENAQLLLRRGRQRPPEHWSLATFERIRTSEVITLAAFVLALIVARVAFGQRTSARQLTGIAILLLGVVLLLRESAP